HPAPCAVCNGLLVSITDTEVQSVPERRIIRCAFFIAQNKQAGMTLPRCPARRVTDKKNFGGTMLQNMRDKAQSRVAKVIVGVIVLVFAMTGWESISRFTSNEQKDAEVNGTVISTAELEQAVSQQRR